ncbi:MAG: bifunctional phosphopantothenoylcysteine decarboxylase/phosphopantothenate--cysteine ligase CoaBC [Flammeovirgaceae bacterium]
MILKGKKILLGITGSIAAYKSALLVRLLKKEGAEIQVIMSESATDFITPLTLATLSEKSVLQEFTKSEEGEWNNHVKLGLWADVMLIAPATANTLAKMANGICDNLLLATYLSARCPVFFCPAMDLDMYAHPSTQNNISKLQQYGNQLIDAEEGELASGLVGKGRMAEPEHILVTLENFFKEKASLPFLGKTVLITAGTTHEFIDPVRFISNGSTGKMGYAIAEEFAKQGAKVILVSGHSIAQLKNTSIQKISVSTAKEMYDVTNQYFEQADIAVFAAAVADYTPKKVSDKKIKKQENSLTIELIKTKDIAKEMGLKKRKGQISVGFALETNDEIFNAKEKLKKKNFDFVVLNSLKDEGAGFGHDTNVVTFIDANSEEKIPLKSKTELAVDIVAKVLKIMKLN